MPFHFDKTAIPDVLVVKPDHTADDRGSFMEAFREDAFAAVGIGPSFVQDNQSRSRRGVLRGLHYQIRHPQGKLVRVLAGEIFDVAVDLRESSPAFGKWVGTRLSADGREQQWIPVGFAHGFYVMSDWAEVLYKTTDYYAPEWERTLRWDDPSIGIDWPISGGRPQLSDKDLHGAPFAEAECFD